MNYQKCASDAKLIEEHHQEYSSSNTKVLNLKETMELLKKLDLFKDYPLSLLICKN